MKDELPMDMEGLTCFTDSPDVGKPGFICSGCGEEIGEDDLTYQIWAHHPALEIRLCAGCFEKRTGLKVKP